MNSCISVWTSESVRAGGFFHVLATRLREEDEQRMDTKYEVLCFICACVSGWRASTFLAEKVRHNERLRIRFAAIRSQTAGMFPRRVTTAILSR